MKISFDPKKEEWTRRERGLSLALGAEIIANARVRYMDERFDYGENRKSPTATSASAFTSVSTQCAATDTT
jgi:uncharacterized DUF497 family protein